MAIKEAIKTLFFLVSAWYIICSSAYNIIFFAFTDIPAGAVSLSKSDILLIPNLLDTAIALPMLIISFFFLDIFSDGSKKINKRYYKTINKRIYIFIIFILLYPIVKGSINSLSMLAGVVCFILWAVSALFVIFELTFIFSCKFFVAITGKLTVYGVVCSIIFSYSMLQLCISTYKDVYHSNVNIYFTSGEGMHESGFFVREFDRGVLVRQRIDGEDKFKFIPHSKIESRTYGT